MTQGFPWTLIVVIKLFKNLAVFVEPNPEAVQFTPPHLRSLMNGYYQNCGQARAVRGGTHLLECTGAALAVLSKVLL